MKGRWRDFRLIAQTMVVTIAICFVLFYVFGDRLPTAPSGAERVGGAGGEGTQSDPPPVSADRRVAAETQSRGNRVAMPARRSSREAVTDLAVPVAGVARSDLVDSYRDARSGGTRWHEAIDILAASGTPVYAAAAGTVEKLFWSDLGGNTIYVRAPNRRRIYYYAHLDAYRMGLEEGQMVRPGVPLGTVGSTGNADPAAPHLHFAILETLPDDNWSDGRPVNPYPLLTR